MAQSPNQGRRESGWGLSYALAAIGILTSLTLGVATLMLGVPVDPDAEGPSVSIEELDPRQGADTPNDTAAPDFDPQQAALVAAEDDRIFATLAQVRSGSAPREVKVGNQLPTLVLPARPTPYTLSDLTSNGAVVRQPDGTLLMQKGVLVGNGAQLHINAPNTTLHMVSGPNGFATLLAFKGSITLEGGQGAPLSISSWDPAKNTSDTEVTNGRSYIRTVAGRMDLRSVNTRDLGFWSGRTGGVAWTGTTTETATGSARAVNFVGNHYGLYSDRTKGLLINGGQVQNSAMDGVAVNLDSEGTELWRVVSTQNARNGIAITRGAHDVSMREVTATGNARNGIFIDGSPPALGPNAAARPTDNETSSDSSGYTVDGSTVEDNAEHGILLNGADNTELTRNTIGRNRDGVIVRGVTEGVVLRENQISSPGGYAVAIRDGSKDTVVTKNKITDALTGVQVNDAVAKISGNEIDQMTQHAVSFIGDAHQSTVVDNRIAGRGPSAIDAGRVVEGAIVNIGANDDSNWVVDRDDLQYLASYVRGHPLILLWALILVFPLAGRIYFKNRRNRQSNAKRHPYEKSLVLAPAAQGSRPSAPGRPPSGAPGVPPGAAPPGGVRPVNGQNGAGPRVPARNAGGGPGARPASGMGQGPSRPSAPGGPAARQQPNSRQPAGARQPGKPAAPGQPTEQSGNGQHDPRQQPGQPPRRPAGKPDQGPNKRPPQGGGGTRVTVVSPR